MSTVVVSAAGKHKETLPNLAISILQGLDTYIDQDPQVHRRQPIRVGLSYNPG